MYRPGDYLWMLTDDVRVGAYADAIRATVRPGHRVLEIGAGFGFFSVLAVRAGAAHVDAIDTNPVVHLGRHVAEANGCLDNIAFHHADSARLDLARRADVIVSDLRGPTPFCRGSLTSIIDARQRLLAENGVIIAARDRLFVALARSPAAFRDEVLAAHDREGVVMTPVERVVHDTPLRCAIAPGDLLTRGLEWCRLEYGTLNDASHEGHAAWRTEADGIVDGLAVWFDTETAAGAGFSTAPGSGARAYGQMYLPLASPVAIASGRRIRATLSAHLVGHEYLWSWALADEEDGREPRLLARQNSVAELVVDPAAFPPETPARR